MADRAKLARLDRLARIRAVERLRAAEEAAKASAQQGRLTTLAQRSRALAQAYGRDTSPASGQALAGLMGFRAELVVMSEQTARDAGAAEARAAIARQTLAAAERRQDQVEERQTAARRAAMAAREAADTDLARILKKRS